MGVLLCQESCVGGNQEKLMACLWLVTHIGASELGWVQLVGLLMNFITVCRLCYHVSYHSAWSLVFMCTHHRTHALMMLLLASTLQG